MSQPIRVLIAKPGLDGHDRGALVVAQGLRDEGMEVIYTGLRQTPEQIVLTAIQEDVACIGLSSLSGAHLELFPEVVRFLREQQADDILVIGGGVIPPDDIEALKADGISAIFTPGSSIREMADYIRSQVADRQPDDWFARIQSHGVDHVGIAVSNLTDACEFYKSVFGFTVSEPEAVANQGVRAVLVESGNTRLELIEPLDASSPIQKFLDKRGPGLHHVAYLVDDIELSLAAARTAGIRLLDEAPRMGVGGKWIAFLHPKDTGGTLIELCQKRTE